MATFVLKTITKRLLLPCSVLVIFYLVFITLVVNQIIFVGESDEKHSEGISNVRLNVLKSTENDRRYDKEIATMMDKLKHNFANKSKQSFHDKLNDAGINMSQDGIFIEKKTFINTQGNESSQQNRFVFHPHPAKLPKKDLTDEEISITSRTEDLQTDRKKVLKAVCDNHRELHNLSTYERMDFVLTDKSNKLIYAMVPKVASTTWIQLMIIHSGKFFDQTMSFHNINYRRDHIAQYGLSYMNSLAPEDRYSAIKNYYSWVFTRHPFERLVSAYRNKLNPGIPWYHERYGREIALMVRSGKSRRSRGDDITFQEFVRYLVQSGKFTGFFDEHWRPMHQLAFPCVVDYDFVGKLETLHEDIKFVLKKAYGLKSVDDSPFRDMIKSTDQNLVAEFFKEIPASDVDQLREIYSLDFQLFDYSSEIPKVKLTTGPS